MSIAQTSSSMFFGVLSASGRIAHRTGFTLVEVLLVIVLVGLLSSVVVVRLSGVKRQGQVKDTVDQILFFDQVTRQVTRHSNRPAMLVFDLDRQQIQRSDAQGRELRGRGLALDQASAHIDEVLVGSSRVTSGQMTIPCSAQGMTPSYVLAVSGSGNRKYWLFVAGLTGQSRTFTDREQVQSLIEVRSHAKP